MEDFKSYISSLQIEKNAFIDGQYVAPQEGKRLKKVNSYEGLDLSGIADCDEKDIDKAVKAAQKAYESGVWSQCSVAERKRVILCLADCMEKSRKELAALDTMETCRSFGNYFNDSIPKAIEAVRYFAEAVDKIYDRAVTGRDSMMGIIKRIPLGVVGIITPWNDPMVVSMWKIIPALLMGNSVVVKPAEESSLSIIKVAGLAKKAGVPDGVLNVVPGEGEVAGKALALHKDVKGIFFTGSAEVGKKLLIYAGESNMKKIGLECGGKGPYIVSSKCENVGLAAETLAENMFYNQGQICSAPSRVIVDSGVKDKFVECLKKAAQQYIPHNPYHMESRVGCMVSRQQYEKVQQYIEYAKEMKYDVFQAERDVNMPADACCISPTIISGLDNTDKLAQCEIFGPVVVILESDSLAMSIQIANDSNYGLAGAVWTNDIDEAYYVAEHVNVGLMHINSYGEDDNSAPFGGVKESGLGKDKSIYAFDEYSDLKTIWMKFGTI